MDCDLKMKDERLDDSKERGRDRERSSRRDRPSRFSSGGRERERSPIRERRRAGDKRVFVSNVAYEARWQNIKDLFRAEVGEVTFVELFTDENDKSRGCGIVEFETPELASKAIEKMHRFDVNGRKLVVKEDIDVERDKYGRPMPNRNRGGGDREPSSSSTAFSRDDAPRGNAWDGGNNHSSSSNAVKSDPGGPNSPSKYGNTYGLSPQFLESLWITGPLVSKVFVANLDYKVDDKKLREVFRLAGRVLHAEINVDKEGKSRGFGVVEYEHPVEAVQAISLLHNQVLYDRRLTVRMDRVEKPDGPPKLPDGLKGIGMGLGVNGTILHDVTRNIPSMNNNSPPPPLPSLPNVQTLQAAAAAAQAAQAAQVAQVAQAAQAAQVAQGAQLGQNLTVSQSQLAGLTGTNPLGHGLAGVSSLLAQSLNVTDLASLNANANFGNPNMNFGNANTNFSNANTNFGNATTNFGNAALNSSQPLNAALGAAGLAAGLGQALNPNLASGINTGIGNALNNNMNPPNVFLGPNNTNANAFGNTSANMNAAVAGYGSSRDFDSMSAALGNTSAGNFSSLDRDSYRGGSSNNSFNGSRQGGNNVNNVSQSSSNSRGGSDTVIVKNLPSGTTWMHLRDKFRDIGDIQFAEMRSKDTGVIRFSHEWEAELAVRELDRTRVEGRTIDVLLF